MRPTIFHRGGLAAFGLVLVTFQSPKLPDSAFIRLTPNGVDDTAQLQAALESCSGAAPACRIELSEGVFHTDVLLVHDFRGQIQGQGMGNTILRPITTRPLRSTDDPFLMDPTLEEPYPILLHFANGGDVELADFTLDFPEDMQVETWDTVDPVEDALLSAIMVDGTETARLLVSRLEIIAAERSLETSVFGSTLLNAIRFEGQLRSSDPTDQLGELTTPLAAGHFAAHDTRIRGGGLGFALRDLRNAHVRIVDNDVQDTRLTGVFLADLGKSQALVQGNRIASELFGVFLLGGPRPPEDPSTISVQRNTVLINERGTSLFGPGEGVLLLDFNPSGNINRVFIHHNDITLGEAFDGIAVLGDRSGGVQIKQNQISGPALDAGITILDSRGTRIQHDDFPGLEPRVADVWLLSTTSECVVIERDATVLDEGSNNKVNVKS